MIPMMSKDETIAKLSEWLHQAHDIIARRDAIIAERDATVAGLMSALDRMHEDERGMIAANEDMHMRMCNANLLVAQLEWELKEARR